MVNPHGIWQSADYRLTTPHLHRLVTDTSVKQLVNQPYLGWPYCSVLAYTGLGRIPGDEEVRSMAEWLTAMLRGEQRPVYRSLERIAELATDHIGNRSPHWFVAAGYRDGVPWYAQITNATLDGGAEQEFDLRIQELRSGETGLSVAPHPSVIPESDLRTLWKVNRLESGPRDPEEFLDLLAAVTRRTSEAGDPTVSASCSTVYLPPECEPARGKTHGASLMEGPQKMAIGVDLSEVGRLLVQRTRAMKEDDDFEEEEWERRHAEAAERMDTPESDDE